MIDQHNHADLQATADCLQASKRRLDLLLADQPPQTGRPITICADCVHCDRSHVNWSCRAPSLLGDTQTNYVTGKIYRAAPLCQDVNKHGNCPHYRGKPDDGEPAF